MTRRFMAFWERTWQERSDVIGAAFGDTDPPGMVTSFSWNDRIRCPGACALTFPPIEQRRDPIRFARVDWLYTSLGLSQPKSPEDVETNRKNGHPWSGYGYEMAMISPAKCSWAVGSIYRWLTVITDGDETGAGHRFPFGFYVRDDGALDSFIGSATDFGVTGFGEIRGALHWPYLFPDSRLRTSTGKFDLLVATGITEAEWEFAKANSSTHIQLLLCTAGIGQRTVPERKCVVADSANLDERNRIESMSEAECALELKSGIGRWHLVPEGAS